MFGQTDASLFTCDRKTARSRYSKNEIYCTMHFNGLTVFVRTRLSSGSRDSSRELPRSPVTRDSAQNNTKNGKRTRDYLCKNRHARARERQRARARARGRRDPAEPLKRVAFSGASARFRAGTRRGSIDATPLIVLALSIECACNACTRRSRTRGSTRWLVKTGP
jgi:hypothetical protein